MNIIKAPNKTLCIGMLLILCVARTGRARAQGQEATVLLYNVGFGGVASGIGALINKPKTAKWHQAFVKGFWQGSLGGFVNYSSKKALHWIYLKQSTFYALPATILNAAGYSIIESAAMNRPFLQHWSIDYGPARIDFSTRDRSDLKIRLLPGAIYSLIDISRYGTLDLKTSLLSGSFAFSTDKSIYLSDSAMAFEGLSSGRAFIYNRSNDYRDKYQIIAHEMVHGYQYREYQIFNSWLSPLGEIVRPRVLRTVFSRYIYLDVPYFSMFYSLYGQDPDHYFSNFYEFEAERFSTNKYVPLR